MTSNNATFLPSELTTILTSLRLLARSQGKLGDMHPTKVHTRQLLAKVEAAVKANCQATEI